MVDSVASLSDLQIAHELMVRTKYLSEHMKGKRAQDLEKEKKEDQHDKALISDKAKELSAVQSGSNGGENIRIKLSDLFARLDELRNNPQAALEKEQQSMARLEVKAERRTTEIEVKYNVNKPVMGLEVINENIAHTDRYLFEFRDGATFTIKDKWSGRSTTIWGDPHVDVDDVEGNLDGDFKDLKSSDRYTTLMLQDGTRVTFTALDSGIIEKVDIMNGSQHVQGTGAASEDWNNGTKKLFDTEVYNNAAEIESSLVKGDVVHAGGDGNDWFNDVGVLVWGKTTQPVVQSRPAGILEITVRQKIEQVSFAAQIDRRV